MITIHSITVRFSPRYNRWYAYDSSGNLIYLDTSFVSDTSGLVSGSEYELLGKIVKPSQEGPIFVLMVAAYSMIDNVPSSKEESI